MSTPPSDDGLNDWRRQEMLWTLRWLAAEPDAAVTAVPGVDTPDEIANDLDHWFEIAQQWSLLDARAARLIAAINDEFGRMTDLGADFWSDEAIRSSPEWAEQRERARLVLAEMGESRDDANLGARPDGPRYVFQKPDRVALPHAD
jgi:hypothetical protein